MSRALHHPAIRAGLILALGAGAYANALRVPFHFDDFSSLPDNASIRVLDGRIFSPPPETTVAARPVTNASFAVNRALTGPAPTGFHVGNIIIHLSAALVLLALVRRTLLLSLFQDRFRQRADALATAIAAVWIVHPIETESVTYLVQRVESLAALFILLTLYASLRAATDRSSGAWSLAAVLFCSLAIGSKETGAVAPLLVVLYDRAFLFPSLRQMLLRRKWLYSGLALNWLLAALLIGLQERRSNVGLHFGWFGPLEYLRVQAGAIVHYIRLVLWPWPLVFDYGEVNDGVPVPTHWWQWVPQGLALAVVLAAALLAWRRHPGAGFLGLSFFVLLGPSSSLIPVTTEVISEHRVYLASAVVLIAVVLFADAILQRASERRSIEVALAGLAVAMLFALTVRRNLDYRSAASLWEDTVRHRPDNPRAILWLADSIRATGDTARYEQLVAQALAISPNHADARQKAGEIADDHGHCDVAISDYRIALDRKPADAALLYRLANCEARLGSTDDSLGHYRRALALRPDRAEYHASYASALSRKGQFEEALDQLKLALQEQPDFPSALFNLGGVYVRMHQYPEALKAFHDAARLKPGFAMALERAGIVAGWLGRFSDAENDLAAAIAAAPDRPEAREDLAWALATRPDATAADAPRALDLAREAVRLSPKSRHAWDVLAATEASAGEFPDAARDAQRALDVPASGYEDGVSEAIQARLESYRAGKPWRAPLRTP